MADAYVTPSQIKNLQNYLKTNSAELPGDLVANLSKEIQNGESTVEQAL